MQDAVERILEGNFNRDVRALDFSSPVIELTLREGEQYEGSFTIYGPEKELTEGTVSSTNMRMKLLTTTFLGAQEEIGYQFHSEGLSVGDKQKGEFRVISNQGEYFIPYQVTILAGILDSPLGNMKNLFHFANLARTNWEEAVTLFYSKDFKQIFQGADRQYYCAYRGLVAGEKNSQKLEEFLLEVKKKQETEFLFEDVQIQIDDPENQVERRLVIRRNGWGYCELFLEKEGDFLILEKEVIREEDFLGNCCRLPFYIAKDRLHAGQNYGKIRLYNPYVSLTAQITVLNKTKKTRLSGMRLQKKHLLLELMQYYEAFRGKKISAVSWLKETSQRVEKLIELDERDLSAKLFQVQLLVTEERYQEGRWHLNQIEDVIENEGYEPALYCYYLYLNTLVDREESAIDEAASRVERIFTQNSDNWRIAWLLLYLSEDYAKSPSRKWLVLEQQFQQGCKSPVLYIEAWNLLAANPTLLMRLERFELQVLRYAAKKDLLTPGIISQITYLAGRARSYSYSLFQILKVCYRMMPGDEILMTICTLLIKGNITEEYAFPWYEKGIEKELRVTRLYEYYMMSLQLDEERSIPRIVLMYFAFDSSLDSLHNSYLYAYVYKNRGQFPELYENYREQMERFMVFQLLKGKNNRYLAYLYKNLITPAMVTEKTAQGLVTALFTHRLTFRRGDIRKVILVYEKEEKEVMIPVMGREVYIPVYGSDVSLLLEDERGNRFCREEEYQLERLMLPDKLSAMIAPYVEGNTHFDLWLCDKGKELTGISDNNVSYMRRIAQDADVLPEVRQTISMRLINFYYDQDHMKELDEYLQELSPAQAAPGDFQHIVRFMVIRGMYEKAYEWIKLCDGEGIEAKLIVRLCSRLLALEGMTEDEQMTALVYTAFRAGKYDESLLTYLCRYFKGTCREMRDIWKAAEGFGIDTYELCERILVQMLYTGAHIGEKADIFRCYVSGGARSNIERAFLAQCCYDYFVHDRITHSFVLEDLQRVIEREEEVPLVCKLAYTKYYAENRKQADERITHWLRIFLRELLAMGKYFPYYKDYADQFTFMRQFEDKVMLEYRMKAGNCAVLHYLLEKNEGIEGEYVEEEMEDMFGGVCVKQFILFFGENLQYYITESGEGREQLTESGTLGHNDTGTELRGGKYHLLTDIAISRNLHDYDTMENLLYEYYEQEHLSGSLFHMR